MYEDYGRQTYEMLGLVKLNWDWLSLVWFDHVECGLVELSLV